MGNTIGKWWFDANLMVIFDGMYPLVMTNIAMEAMAH